MEKFTTLSGIAAPLMRANIDTGAIIAPIYMLSRSIDLGQKLFASWRYDPDGVEKADFVLNQPRYRNSQILIGGPNFGCGSSREHAAMEPRFAAAAVRTLPRTARLIPMKPVRPERKAPAMKAMVR